MMSIVMPCDFDVHLNRGDAFFGAGDFEVHLAERVFEALDVGENRVLVALEDQAHRDAGDVIADRHAGVHQRERRSADRRHRRRSVGLEHFAHQAQRVRKLVLRRKHRQQRAFGEIAVTDFAAAGAAHRARLADRVRREVVEVHVALVFERDDAVEPLRVAGRAERRGGEDLRLAAREDARAVNARHVVHLAPDRTDLVGLAAVGTNLLVDDHRAKLVLFHRLDDLVELFGGCRQLRAAP